MTRNTIQRLSVLQAVHRLKNHPTAEEVYRAVTADCPTVSRGTVYRNLRLLCDQGEIRRVEAPGEADRFDHRLETHGHAKCLLCGRILDVELAETPDPARWVADAHGFSLRGFELFFTGLCAACAGSEPSGIE